MVDRAARHHRAEPGVEHRRLAQCRAIDLDRHRGRLDRQRGRHRGVVWRTAGDRRQARSAAAQGRVCRCAEFGRITIIYDKTVSPIVNAVGLNFKFYDGSETQPVDPTIEAARGVGLTSAYRGQMYCVFKNFPIDLFVEQGQIVEPLFAALISDDTASSIVTETFPITTGTPSGSHGTVDWTSGVAYWTNSNSSSYRIVASNLWGNHNELYDIPIVNLSTTFNILQNNEMVFVEGLGLLLAIADGGGFGQTFVLINPHTGRIIAEATSGFHMPFDNPGNFTWSVDTTGAHPIYLFAIVGQFFGVLEIFKYDPATLVLSSLGHTTDYLSGAAPSVSATVLAVVRGKPVAGQAVFYVGSSADVHKVTVGIDDSSVTVSTFVAIEVNQLLYLPQEDCLVVFSPAGLASKYRCSDGARLWQVTLAFTVTKPSTGFGPEIFCTDGWRRSSPVFGYVTATAFWLINLTDGSAHSIAHSQTPFRLTLIPKPPALSCRAPAPIRSCIAPAAPARRPMRSLRLRSRSPPRPATPTARSPSPASAILLAASSSTKIATIWIFSPPTASC
jgi:hypothetical protein